MKNKNDTWLGFFKKTLKVSGLFLLGIIVLIGIGLYFSFKHESYTYLSCTESEEDKKYNESIPKAYHDNIEVGTIGIEKLYTRLTFVCYLRENLVNCPDEINPVYLTKSGHSKIKV